jgi:hypothetical protein
MHITDRTELYVSSNGDRWELGRDSKDRRVVIHTPNAKSGGTVSITDAAVFLSASHYGPEHQALLAILHAETG